MEVVEMDLGTLSGEFATLPHRKTNTINGGYNQVKGSYLAMIGSGLTRYHTPVVTVSQSGAGGLS